MYIAVGQNNSPTDIIIISSNGIDWEDSTNLFNPSIYSGQDFTFGFVFNYIHRSISNRRDLHLMALGFGFYIDGYSARFLTMKYLGNDAAGGHTYSFDPTWRVGDDGDYIYATSGVWNGSIYMISGNGNYSNIENPFTNDYVPRGAYSSNGSNWTRIDMPLVAEKIVWNTSIFCAVGYSYNNQSSIMWTRPGEPTTFISQLNNNPFSNGLPGARARGIAAASGTFVAVGGDEGSTMATSTDGSNWIPDSNLPYSNKPFQKTGYSIDYNDRYWAAVGIDRINSTYVIKAAISSDLQTWITSVLFSVSLNTLTSNRFSLKSKLVSSNNWLISGSTDVNSIQTGFVSRSSNLGTTWNTTFFSNYNVIAGLEFVDIPYGSLNTIDIWKKYYYTNQSDATAKKRLIGYSSSRKYFTIGSYSNWFVDMSNSLTNLYNSNSPQTQIDNRLSLYPAIFSIGYFSNQIDAHDRYNFIEYSTSYTVLSVGEYSSWKLASNSTGYSPYDIVNAGALLDSNGTYYLYAFSYAIGYFGNQADALAQSNLIESSNSYIVSTVGQTTRWFIATNSSGVSPKTNIYTAGMELDSGGTYYLYPSSYSVGYYSNQADALSQNNLLAFSNSYIVAAVGGRTTWFIASNSTGSSPMDVYTPGMQLNSSGTYYLYPSSYSIGYYSNEADALVQSNLMEFSNSYTVATVGGYSNWMIASNSTGSFSISSIYTSGILLNSSGTYYLYPKYNVSYYRNQTDSLEKSNAINFSYSYTLVNVEGYSNWFISTNSTGTSPQFSIYPSGYTLDPVNEYYVFPLIPCFLEGTKILCLIDSKEEYLNIESIRKGTLVKTSLDGYKEVTYIGYSSITNYDSTERLENRLYIYKSNKYNTVNEDLILTGAHSILVDSLTDKQREQTMKALGDIFITGDKYRLMAFLDDNAEPWPSKGVYTVWHLALDNKDIFENYGIYANGLLVESASIRSLRDKSNMIFV